MAAHQAHNLEVDGSSPSSAILFDYKDMMSSNTFMKLSYSVLLYGSFLYIKGRELYDNEIMHEVRQVFQR